MAALDVATVIHLDGAAADWVLEDEYLDHLGPDNPGEMVGWLARWRDFVDSGLHVAAATDTPWIYPGFALTDSVGRPTDQIAGGMDGRGLANPTTPDWVLDQLLTAEQGLRAVTVDAAWALGDEARRGHLATGTLGDVTILSGDVLAATPDEIRAMTMMATIVDGEAVYCGARPSASPPLREPDRLPNTLRFARGDDPRPDPGLPGRPAHRGRRAAGAGVPPRRRGR